ncbi:Glycerol transport system permease protein OS=Castellaniella defragrans OX=75697 GN=HNR28_000448 PE=3 SV=1 [Castellaniella defragrans]
MAIPSDLYEAADVDGATTFQKFRFVTIPAIAGMYLTSTALSTIWSLGDFNTVYFLTGGGPGVSTQVLATLGIRYAFFQNEPGAGMATVITALPLLLPLVFLLLRWLRRQEI